MSPPYIYVKSPSKLILFYNLNKPNNLSPNPTEFFFFNQYGRKVVSLGILPVPDVPLCVLKQQLLCASSRIFWDTRSPIILFWDARSPSNSCAPPAICLHSNHYCAELCVPPNKWSVRLHCGWSQKCINVACSSWNNACKNIFLLYLPP